MVVPAEQRGEQLADRHEAAAHVDAEKHEDDERRDGRDDVLAVMEALGEEVGHRDGVAGHHGVAAEASRHELPVEVRADSQADGGPHGVGRAGEVGQARQAHEQPAAHVGCLGAQSGQPRADAAASREVLLGG